MNLDQLKSLCSYDNLIKIYKKSYVKVFISKTDKFVQWLKINNRSLHVFKIDFGPDYLKSGKIAAAMVERDGCQEKRILDTKRIITVKSKLFFKAGIVNCPMMLAV